MVQVVEPSLIECLRCLNSESIAGTKHLGVGNRVAQSGSALPIWTTAVEVKVCTSIGAWNDFVIGSNDSLLVLTRVVDGPTIFQLFITTSIEK